MIVTQDEVETISVAVKVSRLRLLEEAVAKTKDGISNVLTSMSSIGGKRPDRVFVRLSHSRPFPAGSAVPELVYEDFFTSEVCELAVDGSSRFSVCAYVSCPSTEPELASTTELDRIIQIRIILSSQDLNRGKESTVALGSIGFRQLLRNAQFGKPVSVEMISSLCPGVMCQLFKCARTSVAPLHTPTIQSAAPPKMKNPLVQHYAFWRERVGEADIVVADEYTIEPRLTFKVPLVVLEQVHTRLVTAAEAWRKRYHIERVRQGYFNSPEEASMNGYCQVRVKVPKARHLSFPQEQETKGSLYGTALAMAARAREGNFPRLRLTKAEALAGFDSCVLLEVETRGELFSTLIGATNVEYSTTEPVYGSNSGAERCQHSQPCRDHKVYNSAQLTEANEFIFYVQREKVTNSALKLSLRQEAYSLQRGVEVVTRGFVSLALQEPFDHQGEEVEMWLPVLSLQDKASMCGELCVQVAVLLNPLTISGESLTRGTDVTGLEVATETISYEQQAAQARIDQAENPTVADSETPLGSPVEIPRSNVTSPETLLPETYISGEECVCVFDWDLRAVLEDCYSWLSYLGFVGDDPLKIPNCEGERVDIPYPLAWLEGHVLAIATNRDLVARQVEAYRGFVREGRSFRSSQLKKHTDMQAAPINLHMQLLCVHEQPSTFEQVDLLGLDDINANSPRFGQERHAVLDYVTTGACTTHALGFKKGGLSQWTQRMGIVKQKIDVAKDLFLATSVDASLSSPTGGAADVRWNLVKEVLNLETLYVEVAMRRLFVMCQAISITVNSILMKLELLAEGAIDGEVADQWVQHGILVCFEGLLSTSGNERGMIEDTISAMQIMKQFTVRIMNKDPRDPTKTFDAADVGMSGREACVYLPDEAIEALPLSLRPGTQLRIVPVLFTQGIDVKQSLANTFGAAADGPQAMDGPALQHHTNLAAVRDLNAYCHRCKPVMTSEDEISSDGRSNIHPLLERLKVYVDNESLQRKNVDGLIEAERVCKILNGVRVTFCKSGKDRTGMAVTLEQSRFLGELFGLDTGEGRLLNDANLMRARGTRLMIAAKNIGRPIYSMNKFQVQFMPLLYRPPPETVEQMIMGTINRDTS